MKHNLNPVAVILLVIVVFLHCDSDPKGPNGEDGLDYVSLIDSLRAAGATVEPAGEIEQPFFPVTGRVIKVNCGDVQVFEFADESAATDQAEQISPDGEFIGDFHVNWIDIPHLYKGGKLIVVYVGQDNQVIVALEAVLGQQFAGG